MDSKAKKLGKILVFAALGLFVLWCVFMILRYAVFQGSRSVGQGLRDQVKGFLNIFGDLHFYDDKFTILWKASGWIVSWFAIGFGILLVIDGIAKKKPLLFIATAAVLIGGGTVIAFIGMSGDYFYYMEKFAGNNMFNFFGLLGIIVLSIAVFCAAVGGAILLVKDDEEECCCCCGKEEKATEAQPAQEPAKEAPAEQPAEVPAQEEAK